MKIAKIRPACRKDNRQEINNYIHISILPVFSKILEKIIYNRLLSFDTKHNILIEDQNGFRENKLAETASQTFIENVQEALDGRSHAIGIFFDLTKAYDVIDHDILLAKLDYYGIRGTAKAWLKSYLSH
jgi:hypothetical protein